MVTNNIATFLHGWKSSLSFWLLTRDSWKFSLSSLRFLARKAESFYCHHMWFPARDSDDNGSWKWPLSWLGYLLKVLALVENLPREGRIGQQPSGMVCHFIFFDIFGWIGDGVSLRYLWYLGFNWLDSTKLRIICHFVIFDILDSPKLGMVRHFIIFEYQ